MVEHLDSYTEISPSGTGLHIWAYGDIPIDGRNNRKLGIEMYKARHYLTVTGNAFGPVRPLAHREKEVAELYVEAFPDKAVVLPMPAIISDNSLLEIGLQRDRELIERWSGARKNGNESSDDLSLMNKLAYWCNRNVDQMVAAFLRSPYASQKDEKHQKKAGRKDYLLRTAQKAANECAKTAAEDNQHYRRKSAQEDFQVVIGSPVHFINPIESAAALKRYTLDDMGAARLFADTFRGRVLYLPEYKCYWVYGSGAWQQDKGDLKVRQLAKEMADYVREIIPPPPEPEKAVEPVPLDQADKKKDPWAAHRKHYGKYRFLGYRKTLIQDAQDELGGRAVDFDTQPFLLNMKNGTFNLQTMELQKHDPTDKLSKMANVSYDPTARCERFEHFVYEITEGLHSRADILQKALGYSLKGEANEECYFTAIGQKTRNGKGTLFDTVLNILGSYGAQMDFNTIARGGARDGSRATPDLARLIGIRFALANEPEKGVCINEALLKQLTGGDDITARPLYGDLIEFKPKFKLFVTANSKPTVSDDSLFSSGRIKLLPFTRHFSEDEQDANLKSSFRTEQAKSGILNWMLDGYQLYLREGLKDTEEMKSMVAEYRRENDYIGQYLDDRFNFSAKGITTLKALRCDYASWCSVVGTKPLGLKGFKEELEKRDVSIKFIHGRYCIDGAIRDGYDYVEENTT
ncbi:phage/plasmid primase, P4 family [Caproicibacter fermentans]|nr:phage/plasmid primase, P4 family [Caproicibacter fermentans]